MRSRRYLGPLAVAVVALAAGIGLWRWQAPRPVRMLPPGDTIVYLDLSPLRASGALLNWTNALGTAARSPNYAAFVHDSRFDYERDLDAVALSLEGDPEHPDDATCILTGRFTPALSTYLAAHAQQRVPLDGTTTYRYPGWSRPDRPITVAELDSRHLLVTNAPDPGRALAAAQKWWPRSPSGWPHPLWGGSPVGVVTLNSLTLAARRHLDGSQLPWRGSRSIQAALRPDHGGLTLQGSLQALSQADAADAFAWAQQQLAALRTIPAMQPLLESVTVARAGDRVNFQLWLDPELLLTGAGNGKG
ncbi:MAG TPA: hypothetical protein VN515_10595 [Terriglobales bacterium]|nr:hypothetical protein [Terriglobales bacterium]